MTLRTPRRRISPRAKRRYRVIRDFFRRALGSSSQQDIKINSSIAVNVTDLKHKIVGIEHQLNEVSRHCQDFKGLENSFKRGTEKLLPRKSSYELEASGSRSHEEVSRSPSNMKLFYKPSNTRTRKSDESDYVSNVNYPTFESRKNMTLPANVCDENFRARFAKLKKKKNRERARLEKECEPLDMRRTQPEADNLKAYSMGKYHLEVPARRASYTEYHREKKRHKRREDDKSDMIDDPGHASYNELINNQSEDLSRYYEEKHRKSRKHKNKQPKVEQDFIADIIKRQYRPRKMFMRKHSDASQFSAPVCRDQEFSLREDIMESPDLCSCCFDRDGRATHLGDVHSVCDTRLYSNRRPRARYHRKHLDLYNDSAFYDVVPVKEKSSPKSRRKFADEARCYDYYKEVLPSPITHRPRLNLKAQHFADYDDYGPPRRRHKRRGDDSYSVDSDVTTESLNRNCKQKTILLKPIRVQTSNHGHRDTGTTSSLPPPTFPNEQVNLSLNENSFNKTLETEVSDKTDKALCEIKDILQSFLNEIKKDASPSTPVDKTETQSPLGAQASFEQGNTVGMGVQTPRTQIVPSAPVAPSAPSAPTAPSAYNNYNFPPQPPCASTLPTGFVPPNTNPCCYPLMCPMNCMPHPYAVPSRSCTCHAACTSSAKDIQCQECCKLKQSNEEVGGRSSETDELLKEIYKFVVQKPHSPRRKRGDFRNEGVKVLTSRSVGGSSRMSRHDANVGTPVLKSYSKSCEAIGSRMIADTLYSNGTRSDTVLEKLSLEVTTQSESDLSSDSEEKSKQGKFAKVLRTLGLLKKKKKHKHISETDSSIEVDIKPRGLPQFPQEIQDYAVHAQEFYHKPPSPRCPRHEHGHGPRYDYHHDARLDPRYETRQDLRSDPHYDPRLDPYGYVPPPPGCEHRGPYYPSLSTPSPHSYTPHRVHKQTIPEHDATNYQQSRHHSPAPPYSHRYDPHYGPDVPLCLKEIEVKSTGTQSDRKISFFSKLGRRTPPPPMMREPPLTAGTQTAPTVPGVRPQSKPALLNSWKKFQDKVVSDINADPMAYGWRTQKDLAQGDKKMRKAMVKKLFYKRNPFSPNNLIIRTLLGNDPSSFGEPKMKLRTRLMV